MAQTAWTIGALLRWTAEHFAKKELDSPRLDAEVLLAHVLGCRRIDLYVRSEEAANDDVRARFRTMIEQRVEGCPVAYIVGRKEFFLLTFEVSPAVLIPRPATETLVLAALERLKPIDAPRILDLGTGSGCIAVSLAKHLPSARFVATDREPGALEIARRNAATHGVAHRIDFRLGDLYEPVRGETFAAIVSNPPYVMTADMSNLERDVRDHEPRIALDGGPDGLATIRQLIAGSSERLQSRGWLMIEIGAGQSAAVKQLVSDAAGLTYETTIADAERIPRILVARKC